MGLLFDLDWPGALPHTSRPARRRKWRPRIEADTPIVPRAVAESVLEEASVWLGEPLPRCWVWRLTARATAIYARNRRFYRRIHGKGNTGRDYLWMFARHWLAALLKARRPELFARLPASYSIGCELPDRS